MAHVNWGTSPLQTAFTAFIARVEWELWEPSILNDFDRWFLWSKCRATGVSLDDWLHQDQRLMFAAIVERQYRLTSVQFEREAIKRLGVPAEILQGKPSFSSFPIRTELPTCPLPCYSPKSVILNSTT